MEHANRWLGWLAAAVLGFGGVLPDAGAETETVDGIPWTYTVSGGVATVGGIPASTTGAIAIPSALGGCPVTGIGSFAFHNHGGLTGVTIGAGVTNVASYAFSFCTNLVGMAIADGVARIEPYALYKCRGLRSLEVPGAWYGTGIVAEALWEPPWFPVTYRGIEPLAVAAEKVPEAREGEGYATTLEAAGGVAPYAWHGGAVRYGESSGENTYAVTPETAAAREWYEAEYSWDVDLPFGFPFFGGIYTHAKINSNGGISFGSLPFERARYDENLFLRTPVIAAMWESLSLENGGMYMEEGAGWVKVQWRAAYDEGGTVNFSATLHEDGRIVLSYGAGNRIGGVIGISAGNGQTAVLSEKSGAGSMRNARDIVFTPVPGMPEWLELTADGVLRGTPEEGGNHPVTVFVEDAAGVTAKKELTLTVADAVAPATQRVSFDANGGTCRKTSLTALVGETYTKLASASWEGHSFLGWYDAREGGTRVRVGDAVPPLSKRTLWARWGGLRQTVHFDANGGTCAKTSAKYFVGETYAGFAIPVREGFSFLGWYDSREGRNRVRVGDIVSDRSELTLWARWGGPRQTVRFDANGGTYAKTAVKYFIGETYAGFKIPTREGFKFLGWYDAKEGGKRVRNGMTVTEDAERTLYAHWQATAASLSITGVSRTSLLVPSSRDARSAGEQEFTLRFEVLADVAYEVQWASSLDGEWTVLEHWIAEEDGEAEIPIPVRPDIPAGFYRLAIADGE